MDILQLCLKDSIVNLQNIRTLRTPLLADNELVERVAKGSDASFAILHNRYRKKVLGYVCLFIRRQDVAEDIAQDVFIKAYRSLTEGGYHDSGKFVPWLMRIARNMVIDYYRKDAPLFMDEHSSIELKVLGMVADETPEKSIIKKQQSSSLRRLVDDLPKEQREVVLLRYYIGLSFKEIADFTDVSVNTALGRMRYALINLKKKANAIERF
jgi:RNA polymerase sigma-70 factor (ECF subfamily)